MGEREQKEGKFFSLPLPGSRMDEKVFRAGWQWKDWQWWEVKEGILKWNNVGLFVNACVWAWISEWKGNKEELIFCFYSMRVSKEIVVYINLSVIISYPWGLWGFNPSTLNGKVLLTTSQALLHPHLTFWFFLWLWENKTMETSLCRKRISLPLPFSFVEWREITSRQNVQGLCFISRFWYKKNIWFLLDKMNMFFKIKIIFIT